MSTQFPSVGSVVRFILETNDAGVENSDTDTINYNPQQQLDRDISTYVCSVSQYYVQQYVKHAGVTRVTLP